MNDVRSTQETFHDGWMRTGDVLRAYEEGFFYLTDRKKELIKYKGVPSPLPCYGVRTQLTSTLRFQVAPAELESHLITHPYVNEGVVCALWDESQSTEIPLAYITLSPTGKRWSDERG
jgi:4-coumarate--CoA ligase